MATTVPPTAPTDLELLRLLIEKPWLTRDEAERVLARERSRYHRLRPYGRDAAPKPRPVRARR